jgi:hypothetical protein
MKLETLIKRRNDQFSEFDEKWFIPMIRAVQFHDGWEKEIKICKNYSKFEAESIINIIDTFKFNDGFSEKELKSEFLYFIEFVKDVSKKVINSLKDKDVNAITVDFFKPFFNVEGNKIFFSVFVSITAGKIVKGN